MFAAPSSVLPLSIASTEFDWRLSGSGRTVDYFRFAAQLETGDARGSLPLLAKARSGLVSPSLRDPAPALQAKPGQVDLERCT